jgi:MinD-like ATPase involved in chromosome partitioning or flagellar assembly
MAGERYVALGLAHVRSAWFTEVARWSTAGSLPLEFVKCVSAEDLRARLASGRSFSAVLVDAALGALDRDLVDLAAAHGCPVFAVDDGRGRDLTSVGVTAMLPANLGRSDLLDAFQQHTTMIGAVAAVPRAEHGDAVVGGWRGRLVAVTGRGGTGSSTVAMALTQGLGDDTRYAGMVALADLSLDADLALLHDARDIVPGFQELVEAHRSGRPSTDEIRRLTFAIANRNYHLLLGLRRHRDWAALRPRALEAAIDGLRRAFRVVVADTDPDLEGEDQCGSYEVEERNLMARTVVASADVVIVVGSPGVKGLHGLVRVVHDLRDHGVAPTRILPVVNGAGRNPRARAEMTRAFAELASAAQDDGPVVGPIFLPDRRAVDDLHRDGARLPSSLSAPLVGAVQALMDRSTARPGDASGSSPQRVTPGSLGTWSGQEAASQ